MKVIGLLGATVALLILVLCLFGCTQNQAGGNPEFLDWMLADLDHNSGTRDRLQNELLSHEWHDLEVTAEEAANYVETISRPKCDSFTVSGTYIDIRSEYSAYLSDLGSWYSHMESASRYMLYGPLSEASVSLGSANDSLERATAHIERVTELLKSVRPGEESPQADTTAPVISAVSVYGVTNRSATISWTTNEVATSRIEYGLSPSSYNSSTSLDSSLLANHSVRVTGLTQNTTYHFRVLSQDAHSNGAYSADYSFATRFLATTPNDADTAVQLEAFLEENFAAVNTSVGPTTFTFDVWYNDSITIGYDYAIRVGYDWSFFHDLQYSIQISPDMNHVVCQELKDHQERLAKAIINRMPGKKLEGGYFWYGYDYPLIHEGYWDYRYSSWVNYEPFLADYEDAEITDFTWNPTGDDTLTR